MREVSWVERAVERADDAVRAAELDLSDAKSLERLRTWQLRVRGYSIIDIANELGISVGTAHADVKWCLEHLPPAYESAEDFRRVALTDLDAQVQAIMRGDPETGHVSLNARKVIQSMRDMQARLLGAYAPSRVDTSLRVAYQLENVAPEEDV